jgi:hypothetical protein
MLFSGCGTLYSHAVKFQPDIFPGLLFVCRIEIDLTGTDEKSLICTQFVFMDFPIDGMRAKEFLLKAGLEQD